MLIRQEKPNDYATVYQVVKTAFASAEESDGTEQDLVTALRQSKAYIPQLSLAAQHGERIIGHIPFTKVSVGEKTELALAPLAVLPDYQRQGVGKALIAEGHRIARELGYNYIVVLGSPAYYSKSGYRPASRFGIQSPFDVPDEYFMAIRLNENAGPLNGVPKYDPAFGIV